MDENNEKMEVTFKSFNILIFKKAFDIYKKKNKNKNNKIKKFLTNEELFLKTHDLFDILKYLLIFCITCKRDEYDNFIKSISLENLENIDKKIQYFIPKSEEDLYLYFTKYPFLIDSLNEELYKIITLENYEGLLFLRKIHKTMYYNVFNSVEENNKLFMFEKNIQEFDLIIKKLIKKYMKNYIEISKIKD